MGSNQQTQVNVITEDEERRNIISNDNNDNNINNHLEDISGDESEGYSTDSNEFQEKELAITRHTTVDNIGNDQIPKEWRENMYAYFDANGKPKNLEGSVRFKMINLFYWLNTPAYLNTGEIDINTKCIKSYQAKIKSHVNKFLTSFELQNHVIVNRSLLMELFVKMLINLPKIKLENLSECKERCDYLYSFIDPATLSYFNNISVNCKSSREILHIKSVLYDLHNKHPERFESLMKQLSNIEFLIALRHTYMAKAYTIAKIFNDTLSKECHNYTENIKHFYTQIVSNNLLKQRAYHDNLLSNTVTKKEKTQADIRTLLNTPIIKCVTNAANDVVISSSSPSSETPVSLPAKKRSIRPCKTDNKIYRKKVKTST